MIDIYNPPNQMDIKNTGNFYVRPHISWQPDAEDIRWQKKLMKHSKDGTIWASDYALVKVFPSIQHFKIIEEGINLEVLARIRKVYEIMKWKELA